nr:Peptide-N(4)-(N-acetyl-beta- glucosaminyl)asparagine amidase [Polyrhizophydium stewartii]
MNQEDIRKLTERFVAMRQASAARGPTQAQAAQAAPSAAAGVAPEAVRLSSAQLSAALSGLSVRAPARVFTARDYQRFLDRILSLVEHVKGYEDFDLQDKAREVIPVDELHAEAHRRQEAEPGSDFDEHLMRSMLRWFKNDFFKWVDKPPCDSCGGSTVAMGVGPPLPDERRFGAGSTEIYRCESCSAITRFPRYK